MEKYYDFVTLAAERDAKNPGRRVASVRDTLINRAQYNCSRTYTMHLPILFILYTR